MSISRKKALAIVAAFGGIVLFFLFIDIGLLPLEDCSPDAALLVAGRPSYRGAFGLWACDGQVSIVFSVVIPLCLFALAALLALWPKR